jgi:hypothetical protein
LAAFARSNLDIPKALAKGISLYLMMSIGLRMAETGFTHNKLPAGGRGLRSRSWGRAQLSGCCPRWAAPVRMAAGAMTSFRAPRPR